MIVWSYLCANGSWSLTGDIFSVESLSFEARRAMDTALIGCSLTAFEPFHLNLIQFSIFFHYLLL